MPHKQFTAWKAIPWIIGVLAVCVVARYILINYVRPISEGDSSRPALELLAVVFGILAAACTGAFFSFSYKDAENDEKCSVQITAWCLIIAFFLLVFLCMYCLRKISAFDSIDVWATWIIFLATFLMLCGLVLIDRWDATLLGRKISKNSKEKQECVSRRNAPKVP